MINLTNWTALEKKLWKKKIKNHFYEFDSDKKKLLKYSAHIGRMEERMAHAVYSKITVIGRMKERMAHALYSKITFNEDKKMVNDLIFWKNLF